MQEAKGITFSDLDHMQRAYIDQINDLYSDDVKKDPTFGYTITDKYIVLKCIICKKYQLWFSYKGKREDPKSITAIKFDRSINQ